MQLYQSTRIDLELALQGLSVEISALEKLRRNFDIADQAIIKNCMVRLNRLILKKLANPIPVI